MFTNREIKVGARCAGGYFDIHTRFLLSKSYIGGAGTEYFGMYCTNTLPCLRAYVSLIYIITAPGFQNIRYKIFLNIAASPVFFFGNWDYADNFTAT